MIVELPFAILAQVIDLPINGFHDNCESVELCNDRIVQSFDRERNKKYVVFIEREN